MKVKPSSYFLLVILLLMMVSLYLTFQLNATHAKFMPLIIITVISALVIVELVREIKNAAKEETMEADQPEAQLAARKESTLSLYALAWIFGFALAVCLLGFIVAIPLSVLVYLRFKSHKGWIISIGLAALVDIFIYFAFEVALQVPLFRGLFFGGV